MAWWAMSWKTPSEKLRTAWQAGNNQPRRQFFEAARPKGGRLLNWLTLSVQKFRYSIHARLGH
ncbi:hypothetical protein RHIZ404_230194 [Rhizobium sp. EC-SD404]|nr:hypothetical protein RHIZ404_230194 [Rhizobium sp. EC-SD404]